MNLNPSPNGTGLDIDSQDYPVAPDPTLIKIIFLESDVNPLIDELTKSAFVQDHNQEANSGIDIQRRDVKQAVLTVIQSQVEAWVHEWSDEDWFRGDLGTALQREIMRQHDDRVERAA
jgi:hypothetical protein